jgi:hypothetical protein
MEIVIPEQTFVKCVSCPIAPASSIYALSDREPRGSHKIRCSGVCVGVRIWAAHRLDSRGIPHRSGRCYRFEHRQDRQHRSYQPRNALRHFTYRARVSKSASRPSAASERSAQESARDVTAADFPSSDETRTRAIQNCQPQIPPQPTSWQRPWQQMPDSSVPHVVHDNATH